MNKLFAVENNNELFTTSVSHFKLIHFLDVMNELFAGENINELFTTSVSHFKLYISLM